MYLDRKPITFEQAVQLLEAINITPKITEKTVNEAGGWVLAQDVRAPFPIPAFRRSGYDGYGILSEDDHDFPREFEIMDNVGAGSVFAGQLQSGQAVRIMTGAKVPDEVGKVIMLEETEKTAENRVLIRKTMKNSNISKIGEEFEEGSLLLEAGTRLNPGAISLLNAFGFATIKVYAKPKVAVLATGSELLKPGQSHEEGKIYNSNGPLLEQLVLEAGGELVVVDEIEDDEQMTHELLKKLAAKADLVISTGGVSVGDFDFMATAAKSSSQFLFNKLAMRPGSPTTAFVLDGTPVLALSGNPGACFTGFYLFAEPMLQRFQGQISQVKTTTCQMAHDYLKTNGFDKWVRAQILENGQVAQVGSDQSSSLGNLHLTTAFFRVPHDTKLYAGDEVEVKIIP